MSSLSQNAFLVSHAILANLEVDCATNLNLYTMAPRHGASLSPCGVLLVSHSIVRHRLLSANVMQMALVKADIVEGGQEKYLFPLDLN